VQTYYEKNQEKFTRSASIRLKQIMLVGDKKQQVDEILDQLAHGVSFESLVQKYATDGGYNGDLGWVNDFDVRPEIARVAFELKPQTYAPQPIDIEGTLFIIYVEDKKPAGVIPLLEVRQEIEKVLAAEIAQEAYEKWIQQLRKQAAILRMI